MMKVDLIKDFLHRLGGEVLSNHVSEVDLFESVIGNEDVRKYITECVCAESVYVSELRLQSFSQLKDENLFRESGPGGYIYPYGFLVFGITIGGQAVCFNSLDGGVYFARTSEYHDDGLFFKDLHSGEWLDVEYSYINIMKALIPIDDDIGSFLEKLLSGNFERDWDSL